MRRRNRSTTSPLSLLLLLPRWLRLLVVMILINIYSDNVYGYLTVRPHLVTESKVNDLTYLNCSSSTSSDDINWYFYPVGGSAVDEKNVYYRGKMHPPYDGRFEVEKIVELNACNLVIPSVEWDDAGKYVCEERDGIEQNSSASADLILIDEDPTCQSNITTGGIVAENGCNITPDDIHLSCSVSYRGNSPPILGWKRVGGGGEDNTDDVIERGATHADTDNNYVTYNLTVKSQLQLDGSHFVCQTTRSTTNNYYCSSRDIKILYSFSPVWTLDNAQDRTIELGHVFNCSAQTNVPCDYRWYNDIPRLVSNNRILDPDKLGWHICRADCRLKSEKNCSFDVIRIYVVEKNGTVPSAGNKDGDGDVVSNTATKLLLLAVLLVIIPLTIATIVIAFICRKKAKKKEDELREAKRLADGLELQKFELESVIEEKNRELADVRKQSLLNEQRASEAGPTVNVKRKESWKDILRPNRNGTKLKGSQSLKARFSFKRNGLSNVF